MKWIGKRISFEEDKQKITVVIRPDDVTWIKGVMGAWVTMWAVIGITVGWYSLKFELSSQEQIIVVIFMIFWLYYMVRVGRSFLWLMWGKELIKINETSFTYKKSIKNYGRATPYFLENITKMRTHSVKDRSFQSVWENSPWVAGGERLEFDHQGKVIRFGRKLEKKDAELLFKYLTKKIDLKIRETKRAAQS